MRTKALVRVFSPWDDIYLCEEDIVLYGNILPLKAKRSKTLQGQARGQVRATSLMVKYVKLTHR